MGMRMIGIRRNTFFSLAVCGLPTPVSPPSCVLEGNIQLNTFRLKSASVYNIRIVIHSNSTMARHSIKFCVAPTMYIHVFK